VKRALVLMTATVMCRAPQPERAAPVELPTPSATPSITASTAPRARDYDDELADFFRRHGSVSAGELCATFQVNVSPRLIIWHVRAAATHASGDDRFDDAMRDMLQKLRDEHTPLPDPPADVAESIRGHTVNLTFSREMRPLGGHCGS
jgi:hypothetical protein